MKIIKVPNPQENRKNYITSILASSRQDHDTDSESQTISLEKQIAVIRRPGKWMAGIEERVLAALVQLPDWPGGRAISVMENGIEVCRYANSGTEVASPHDVILYRQRGGYQSAGDFHAGRQVDEDSLFRAIISELGENSGAKTEVEKQVSAWRHQVADWLVAQESKLPVAETTKVSTCAQNRDNSSGKKKVPRQHVSTDAKGARLKFYDSVVKKPNSTEDVVRIGALISRDISSISKRYQPASPASHSGNRKSSLWHHFLQLISFTAPGGVSHTPDKILHENTALYPRSLSPATDTPSVPVVPHIPSAQEISITEKPVIHRRFKRDYDYNNNNNIQYELIAGKQLIELLSEYLEQSTDVTFSEKLRQVMDEHGQQVVNLLDSYHQLSEKKSHSGEFFLKEIATILRQFENIPSIPENLEASLAKVQSQLKTIHYSHTVTVEPHLHNIWVGGGIDSKYLPYITAQLLIRPDADYVLWVDSQSYGAYYLHTKLKERAKHNAIVKLQEIVNIDDLQKLSQEKDKKSYLEKSKLIKLYDYYYHEELLYLQDELYSFAYERDIFSASDSTLRDYLREKLTADEETLRQFDNVIEENKSKNKKLTSLLREKFGQERIHIREVHTLLNNMTPTLRLGYYQEVLLRGNLAAASDLIRTAALYEYGGTYLDTDLLPAFSDKVTKIIYNTESQPGMVKITSITDKNIMAVVELSRRIANQLVPGYSSDESFLRQLTSAQVATIDRIMETVSSLKEDELFRTMDNQVIHDSAKLLKIAKQGEINSCLITHRRSQAMNEIINLQQQRITERRNQRQRINEGEPIQNVLFKPMESYDDIIRNLMPGEILNGYRSDGIVAHSISTTLYLTGPSVVSHGLKKYAISLGALGEDMVIDPDTYMVSKYFTLGNDDAASDILHAADSLISPEYAGGLNTSTLEEVKSTWANKQNTDLHNIITDLQKYRPSDYLRRKTDWRQLDKNALAFSSTKDMLTINSFFPDIKREADKISTKQQAGIPLTLEDMGPMDSLLTQLYKQLDGEMAKTGVYILQQRLYHTFQEQTYSITDQINLFQTPGTSHEETLESMGLLLKNIPENTPAVLWMDDAELKVRYLYDAFYMMEVNNYFDRICNGEEKDITLTFTQSELVEVYQELLLKDYTGQLDDNLIKEFSLLSKQLQENYFLLSIIDMVKTRSEFTARKKAYDYLSQVSVDDINLLSDFKKNHPGYQSALNALWSKNYKKKTKYYFNKKLSQLPWVQSRLMIKTPAHTDLHHKLLSAAYIHGDLSLLNRYAVIAHGEGGLFLDDTFRPILSDAVCAQIDIHLHAEEIHQKIILSIYQYYYERNINTQKNHHSYLPKDISYIRQRDFISLFSALDKIPDSDFFTTLPQHSVTAAGVRFSGRYGQLSDTILAAQQHAWFSQKMINYFHVLIDIYKMTSSVHLRQMTPKEFSGKITTLFSGLGLRDLISGKSVRQFATFSQANPMPSLSTIHFHLTGQAQFSDMFLPFLQQVAPAVAQNIKRDMDFFLPTSQQFERPLLYSTQSWQVVTPYQNIPDDFKEMEMQMPRIIEKTKFNLLTWDKFYSDHAAVWDFTARSFGAVKTEFHPQSLMFDEQGKCMGLALLYLASDTENKYKTTQQNLLTSSTLYQTKYRDGLPLSHHDEHFLRKTKHIINLAQDKGNRNLAGSGLTTWRLENPAILEQQLHQLPDKKLSSFLVTTEHHSLAIQKMSSGWRVTDPNFGHVDFISIAEALAFLNNMVKNPALSSLYGSGETFIHFSATSKNWYAVALPEWQLRQVTRTSYRTTAERLSQQPEMVSVAGISLSKKLLYDTGAMVNGRRIDVHTPVDAINTGFTINGNILQSYLDNNVMTETRCREIKALLAAGEITPGTRKIKPEQVLSTPAVELPFHARLQQQKQNIKLTLLKILDRLDMQLQKRGISLQSSAVARIDNMLFPEDSTDRLRVKVTDKAGQSHVVDIDVPELGFTFKEGFAGLSEGVEAMNLDAIMSVVGLIQYARLMHSGELMSALDHAGMVMDVKNLLDKALGVIIMAVGSKIYNPGVSGARLEVFIATRLEIVAARVGGTAGRYLGSVARVLKLPVIDLGISMWALYTSVEAYTQASGYAERTVAAVDISFAVITATLALASFAYGPLALVIVPMTLLAHDARNAVSAFARDHERRNMWREAERFLDNGAKNVLNAVPEQGMLDFSNNQVLGGITVDLRHNPPRLTGEPSYNSGKNFGSRPDLTDRQVMEHRAYNWSCHYTFRDAHVPNIWGEDKPICNAVAVTAGAMAAGYANRHWPRRLPRIPAGDYHTVIAGYGATFRASTEVIRMVSGGFREVARNPEPGKTPEPLLSLNHRFFKVVGGDNRLNVIVPSAVGTSLVSHLSVVKKLLVYRFIFQGGARGMFVETGGAGEYHITGDEKAHSNVLSFRVMPGDFPLVLDLSRTTPQHIRYRDRKGGNHTIMTLILRGINTVLGTDGGSDRITGSDKDNYFYPGSGGGEIFSGGGKNVYVIADKMRGRCYIKIAPHSTHHTIQLAADSTQLESPGVRNVDNREFILLATPATLGVMVEGYNGAILGDMLPRITLQTPDGITASWSGAPAELKVIRWEAKAWCQRHCRHSPMPDVGKVAEILSSKWKLMDPLILDYPDYQAAMTAQDVTFTLHSPGQRLTIPDQHKVTVIGSAGSHYSLTDNLSHPVNILLSEDAHHPEIIDITALMLKHDHMKIHTMLVHEILRIIVFDDEKSQVVNISMSSGATVSLAQSQAQLRINKGYVKTLAEIYQLARGQKQAVRLYNYHYPQAARAGTVDEMHQSVILLSRDSHHWHNNGSDYLVLKVKNSDSVNKILRCELISGALKGIWNAETEQIVTADINALPVLAGSTQHLLFTPNEHVLLRSTVTTSPLIIQESGDIVLSRGTWRKQKHIIVAPDTASPSLTLQQFSRYKGGDLSSDALRLIMYQHGMVRIDGRDLLLTLFYLQWGNKIDTLHLTFRNFFIAGITPPTGERNVMPLMASDPLQVIDPKYHSHTEVMLGEERMDLAQLVYEYSRSDYKSQVVRVNSNSSVDLSSDAPLFVLRITPEAVQGYQKLPRVSMEAVHTYFINSQGDLLITQQLNIRQAIVIIYEGYRHHWWEYHNTLASRYFLQPALATHHNILSKVGQNIDNFITFHPFGLQLKDMLSGRNIAYYYYPVLNQNQMVRHTPRSRSFRTPQAYRLWELQQRVLHPASAQVQDSRLMELALRSGKWDIASDILRDYPGYYVTAVSDWPPGWLKAGDVIRTPDDRSINIFLTTTQQDLFGRKGSGYRLCYRMDGLSGAHMTENVPGETRVTLQAGTTFEVVNVDESHYYRKMIFLTLRPKVQRGEAPGQTPAGDPLF